MKISENSTQMKTKQHSTIALSLLLTVLLPSCMMPDPMFTQNSGMIQNVNYPASKIVGSWTSFRTSAIPTNTEMREDKIYYDILPNGRGKVRQSSKNLATGHFIAMEAKFKWKYMGENQWNIMLPSSSEYRVTDSLEMTMGSIGARECLVRYYQGNLYEMKSGEVWVPSNKKNISELTKRRREQPAVFQLNLN